jgi:hypothetical protein
MVEAAKSDPRTGSVLASQLCMDTDKPAASTEPAEKRADDL